MNKDIEQAEALRRAKDHANDRNDYNNEISDRDTGRISRFGIDNPKQQLSEKEKRERSALQSLLLNVSYKASFDAALQAFNQAQSMVYEALIKATDNLDNAKHVYDGLLERASTLPDGTKVFLADDGTAYTEDGRVLDQDEVRTVDWREGGPSWDEAQASRKAYNEAQRRYDEVAHYNNRLDQINHELNDEDNPPSLDRLDELKDELNNITKNLHNNNIKSAELAYSKPTNVHVPDLQL